MPTTPLEYFKGAPPVTRLIESPPILPNAPLLNEVIRPLVARRNARDILVNLKSAATNEVMAANALNILARLPVDDWDHFFFLPEATDLAERIRRGHDYRATLEAFSTIADGSKRPGTITLPGRPYAVGGLPNKWLSEIFPEPQWLGFTDDVRTASNMEKLENAFELLHDVWPEAYCEVISILAWVVPLNLNESFNVPSMRGLIAFDFSTPWRIAADLVHETSHNILSSILDLQSVSTAPLVLVRSPFINEDGPLTSLIHSCWSFIREMSFQRNLMRAGVEVPKYLSTWRKTTKFWELAAPALEGHREYTQFGEVLVGEVMTMAEKMSQEGPY